MSAYLGFPQAFTADQIYQYQCNTTVTPLATPNLLFEQLIVVSLTDKYRDCKHLV